MGFYETGFKRRILKCSAVLKLSKSGQSKLVNALHPSAVKGSNEASCHLAKADLTTNTTALLRGGKKKTGPHSCLQRAAVFSMLNYFHHVFSDAY